jgi:hypothetical protein
MRLNQDTGPRILRLDLYLDNITTALPVTKACARCWTEDLQIHSTLCIFAIHAPGTSFSKIAAYRNHRLFDFTSCSITIHRQTPTFSALYSPALHPLFRGRLFTYFLESAQRINDEWIWRNLRERMPGAIGVEANECHDRHHVATVVGNKNKTNELPELAIVAKVLTDTSISIVSFLRGEPFPKSLACYSTAFGTCPWDCR